MTATDKIGLSCPISKGRSIPPYVPHCFWEAYQYTPGYFEDLIANWVRQNRDLLEEQLFEETVCL